MGTLSTNRSYKIPTVGGDTGGEDGTDTGGWPQQIVDTINAIDADVQTLMDQTIDIPANVCVVLERDADPFLVAGVARTTLGTYTIAADSLQRSLRVEMLGISPASSGSGRYMDVWDRLALT